MMKHCHSRTLVSSSLCLLAAITLLPSSALAQQPGTPSQGIPLPDRSITAQDDASSVEVNPAGLGYMQNAELQYNLQLATPDYARTVPAGHAVFGAFGGNGFGLGFGAQFLYSPNIGSDNVSGDYRKYTIAGAMGDGQSISLGFAYNFFGSNSSPTLDNMKSWDLGAQIRLSQHLGLGLFARDLNAPFLDENSEALDPRWGVGVLLRLWDGRIQLDQQLEHVRNSDFITLTPRFVFEAVQGLRLFARAAFTVSSSSAAANSGLDQAIAGLEVSLGSFGAQGAVTLQNEDGVSATGHAYSLWMARNKKRSLLSVRGKWILLELTSPLSELPASGLFSTPSESFIELLLKLDQIANDPDIEGVVFNIAEPQLGYAQLWELRQSISNLSQQGKKSVSVMQNANTSSVLLASASDKVLMTPNVVYEPNGISAQLLNYKDLLEHFGVKAEFLRVRDYKSAPETFVNSSPSPESLEQIGDYVDALYAHLVSSIAVDRDLSKDTVTDMLNQPPLLPDEALKQGYIDGIIYPDEINKALENLFEKRILLSKKYSPAPTSEERWQRHPEIAIVVVSGAITQGASGNSPLGTDSLAGSNTLIGALERIRKDRNIKAVVLRVDSPGGSALASDQIYRQLRRVAQKKPVVASMGNIAASGGYYVSAGAEKIFASPLTLTGSIGIYTGKFSFGTLGERYGIQTTTISKGERAGSYSVWTPFTEAQKAAIGKSLVYLYNLFLAQISHTRGLSVEEIDKIARGRVWTGTAALDKKLVDQNGGLLQAIRFAEEAAGLSPRQATYKIYPNATSNLFGSNNASVTSAALDALTQPVQQLIAKQTHQEKAQAFQALEFYLSHVISDFGTHLLLPLLYKDGEALMLPPVAIEIK